MTDLKIQAPSNLTVKTGKTYDLKVDWASGGELPLLAAVPQNQTILRATRIVNGEGNATFRLTGLKNGSTILVVSSGDGGAAAIMVTVN